MPSITQAAREQCCNWHDGQCLLKDDLTPAGRCVLTRKEACTYFRNVVIPGVRHLYTDLDRGYAEAVGLVRPRARHTQRLCACGVPLAPRRRYCAACAAKRRKDAYRASKQAKRAAAVTQHVHS